MNSHQKQVDQWFKEKGWPYWSPHEILARLINHVYGSKKKKLEEVEQDLELEIGDIIYTLICLANSHGIDLDQAVQKSIDKVATRDKNRF